MKKTVKFLTTTLAACLLAALCACGGEIAAPEVSPEASQNPESAAERTPTPEPTATPEPTPFPIPARAARADQFVVTMEYNRLYAIPLGGGDATLLADKYASAYDRRGEVFWAAFDDGEIRRYDLAAGTVETVSDIPPLPGLSALKAFDGGFLAECAFFTDLPTYWVYRENGHSVTQFQPPEGEYLSQFGFADGFLIYVSYHDDSPWLRALNLDTGETLWEVRIDYDSNLSFLEDGLYLLSPSAKTLSCLDTAGHVLKTLPVAIQETDMSVLFSRDGTYLVQGSYDDNANLYLLRGEERIPLDIPGREDGSFLWVDSWQGETLLLREYVYRQSVAVPDLWYNMDRFYLLHLDTGGVMPVKVRGEYGSLFAAGDFPVMDSSTARKPVTEDIYSFFCESTGAGGGVPLCSTTHGAWTNMAERTVDIALLAAPTREEQDYLASQGVEAEMKLYGGDALAFIGSDKSGVTDLTLDQVRGIYRGEITNWAQLGGADHPITVLYRDDQSGSQRLFERLVWGEEPVPDLNALGFIRLDEMSALVSQCLYDPYAVGYSVMTYLNDVYAQEDLRIFSLEGTAPTAESVASGAYPLATTGYVVIRADEPADSPARRLYNWFGSPLCDYILTQNGVTPLSE